MKPIRGQLFVEILAYYWDEKRLLHNIHHWSALLLVTFAILHPLRVWLRRVYRYPERRSDLYLQIFTQSS